MFVEPSANQIRIQRLFRVYWAPALVLFLALLATALATYSFSWSSRERDRARFTTEISWTTNAIQERLQIYTCGLAGGAAFVGTGGVPDPATFKLYATRLNLHQSYPGIQGFGFARRTSPEETSGLTSRMRQIGEPDFFIRPEGAREVYFPIIYLEPRDARNQTAIGYDMFAEPIRREAMDRAWRTGEPAASKIVELVQEILPQKQPGFLIYVPAYAGGTVPDEKERREKLLGFLYSPFRAHDLFQGIFQKSLTDVHLDVFDGTETGESNRLFSSRFPASAKPIFSTTLDSGFAGRRWALVFSTTPNFEASSYQRFVPWVFVSGLLLSLILCAITAALARAHRQLHQAQRELELRAENLERMVAARTERLRETIAELEHMSYSIVHDMRAPLRAIQSFGGILEEEAGPVLSEHCRGYITRMKTAAGRMDSLIRDVLNYAKVVQDELPLYPVNVSQLLRGMLDTYPTFHGGAADFHLDPDIPWVVGNEAALTQCFSNLLSNAIKFAKPGQKPSINITGRTENGLVRLCVTDDGVGIAPELQDRVFGMFQRLDTKHEGTGIGLAIVRKAVERMGGKVSVESQVGQGSTFCIELPAASDRQIDRIFGAQADLQSRSSTSPA